MEAALSGIATAIVVGGVAMLVFVLSVHHRADRWGRTTLGSLVRSLIRMAQGELNVEIVEIKRRDEIGDVGRLEAIKLKVTEKAQQEAMAKAEADARAAEQRKAEMHKLAYVENRRSEASSMPFPLPRPSSRPRPEP